MLFYSTYDFYCQNLVCVVNLTKRLVNQSKVGRTKWKKQLKNSEKRKDVLEVATKLFAEKGNEASAIL